MASKPSLTPRAVASRMNARKGGLATAARYGKDFCEQRATKGGEAVYQRYGSAFYSYIKRFRKRSRGWQKGRPRKLPALPTNVLAAVMDTQT